MYTSKKNLSTPILINQFSIYYCRPRLDLERLGTFTDTNMIYLNKRVLPSRTDVKLVNSLKIKIILMSLFVRADCTSVCSLCIFFFFLALHDFTSFAVRIPFAHNARDKLPERAIVSSTHRNTSGMATRESWRAVGVLL